LQSNSTSCLNFTVSGAYATGTALGPANKVDIKVAVTTPGTYSITTTPVSGISFSGSGSFTNTGVQTVTLQGSGSPTAVGTINIPVTAGRSNCSFPISVGAPAAGTLNCAAIIPTGAYKQGTALTTANAVAIQVNVTTAGVYSITTNTVNGFSFSKSGSFATTGIQTVTLEGAGTPTAATTSTFTVNFGGNSCTFPVMVTAGTNPPPGSTNFWKFTSGGVIYQGNIDPGASITSLPPIGAVLNFTGTSNDPTGTAPADTVINIILSDVSGGITVNESYGTNAAPTSNAAFFEVAENLSTLFAADPINGGSTLAIKITAHNTTTKIIEGTFMGTAKDGAGASRTITAGQFKVNYQ
jgi:hypothetical protein